MWPEACRGLTLPKCCVQQGRHCSDPGPVRVVTAADVQRRIVLVGKSGMPWVCLRAVCVRNEEYTLSRKSLAERKRCINSCAAVQSLRKLNQGKQNASSSLKALIRVSRGTCKSRPVAVYAQGKLKGEKAGITSCGSIPLHRGDCLKKEKRPPLFIGVAEVLTWQPHSMTTFARKHPCQTTSQVCCDCTVCMQQ